jgi:SET domain-containing protein
MGKAFSDSITVRGCKFGKGLFSTKDIPKGTVLFIISGRQIKFDEAVILGERESHCVQISPDTYILPDYPFYLTNHSCDPNCGISPQLEFFTLRDIRKDEQLFWDYSTSMFERHWTMKCECGSPLCRQLISDFDLLPKLVQEKYIKLDIVQPFIKNLL